ncbi:cell division protein SepF [Gordonia hirsuta DSM 44140 = NBRC 16056]|uniref:Cell division protein SepF n=1 Tax=Gordonia hirsuta DSM 44140 = NBRC 16056 TaxID=1121927 RepID=L7L405_9ACTN|nr:cell division protein SepF [Gordonia hirsuta]GAC55880.1 cell division protein SepF [Gordonia hirsuta DSM 44140 = NBRC 16056]
MTTMQKFKAYFGMVPPSEYEDDYLADPAEVDGYGDARQGGHRGPVGRRDDGAMSARERLYMERYRTPGPAEPYYDDEPYEADYAEVAYGVRGDGEQVYAERVMHVEAEHAPMAPARNRLEPLSRSANVSTRGAMAPVRGANALAPEVRPEPAADGASRITTLRPADYSEARTIGERFRDGSPVIMDLVDMNNDDAKRMVDFAAGLVFALRGSFDKVATKVFLLSPAGVEVGAEDRRRLAESGFHNQS